MSRLDSQKRLKDENHDNRKGRKGKRLDARTQAVKRWRTESLERFRVDGDSLVDTGSGASWRPLKECERIFSDGLPLCSRIDLVPSHYAQSMALRAVVSPATVTKLRVRITATCQACKRQKSLWSNGWDLSSLVLLLKKWEATRNDAISTTFQLEPEFLECSFSNGENAEGVAIKMALTVSGRGTSDT
jgi:hypothetical protein